MNLRSVVVNCENCIQPGQVGVAKGRADGLCVRNFKQSLCKPHPPSVKEFYNRAEVGEIKNKKTCCRYQQQNEGNDDDE